MNIQKMMAQAQAMQSKMQEELEALKIEASSGGGMVTIEMSGTKEILSVRIDPVCVDPKDVETLQDLIAGHVQMMFDAITTMAANAKAGQVRALGTTGTKRSELTPDVPTLAELGYESVDGTIWFGIVAPAGTPRAVVHRFHDAISRARSPTRHNGRPPRPTA